MEMREIQEKRLFGIISGLCMLGIGLLVRTYPNFFLEWGTVNTIKGLIGWAWVMMIGGAIVVVICGILFLIGRKKKLSNSLHDYLTRHGWKAD